MLYMEGGILIVMFLSSFVVLFFYRYHYLMVLILIDLIMLNLYGIFVSFMFLGFSGLGVLLMFLVMVVCEAGVGICILIYYVRFFGSDFFSVSFN